MKLVSLANKKGGALSPKIVRRNRRMEASVAFFDAARDLAVIIRCKGSGQYKGVSGNRTAMVLSRLSENRYAIQAFLNKAGTWSQINGNMIDTGGIAGVVAKFNADGDVNRDFVAFKRKEVDSAFTGTGSENALRLSGGRGR